MSPTGAQLFSILKLKFVFKIFRNFIVLHFTFKSDSFWVNFVMVWGLSLINSFACGRLVVPVLCVEKTFPCALLLVLYQRWVDCFCLFLDSIVIHQSRCLFLASTSTTLSWLVLLGISVEVGLRQWNLLLQCWVGCSGSFFTPYALVTFHFCLWIHLSVAVVKVSLQPGRVIVLTRLSQFQWSWTCTKHAWFQFLMGSLFRPLPQTGE
jgi:hypothetical protein